MRVVIVVGLKSGQNQGKSFIFNSRLDDLRHRQRIASVQRIVFDVDRAVGPGGETNNNKGR